MIPFNKPVWLGTEIQRITEAITSHGHVAGGGPFNKYCEQVLSRQLGQPTLLVTSCTHALEMAAMLLDLKEGDEFIVPSYTKYPAKGMISSEGSGMQADSMAMSRVRPA